MILEGLVNKHGTLTKAFSQLDPNTIQHALEITNDRRTLEDEAKREELRNTWFWTADSELYRIEDGEAVLYDGDRDTNLIFQNIDEAAQQLRDNHNYIPTKEGIQSVLDSVKTGKTARIVLSKLDLQGNDLEWGWFEIDTSDYRGKKLKNDEQRKFAQRKYGSMELKKDQETGKEYSEFEKNMKMLAEEGKTTTRIYALKTRYVKEKIEEYSKKHDVDTKDVALARASRLYIFDSSSDFNACGRIVVSPDCALRGVPLIGEADAQKIRDVLDLLKNPAAQKIAAEALTPETVLGYSNVMPMYLNRIQKQ